MDCVLNTLKAELEMRGFAALEIPALIQDVVYFVNLENDFSLPVLNEELEDLGWGINSLDHHTYDLIISLAK